jgi:hypothetical protein
MDLGWPKDDKSFKVDRIRVGASRRVIFYVSLGHRVENTTSRVPSLHCALQCGSTRYVGIDRAEGKKNVNEERNQACRRRKFGPQIKETKQEARIMLNNKPFSWTQSSKNSHGNTTQPSQTRNIDMTWFSRIH